MYQLVNDIPAYADFLPWCRQAEVLERQGNTLVARLDLSLGPAHFSLTTRNQNEPDRAIHMQRVDGPFQHFDGRWAFRDLHPDPGCEVALTMEFTFQNTLTGLALGAPFNALAQSLMGCFLRRAEVLYGPEGS